MTKLISKISEGRFAGVVFFLTGLVMVPMLWGSFAYAPLASAQEGSRFETPAEHLIIMDYDTGEVLFEKNARTPMAPASMTKIMTADIVFKKIKSGELSLDEELQVSENAWRKGGAKSGSSTMFLKLGSKAKVRDLIQGVIVQSGNDACIVLAEGIAGSEADFADMMNEEAKALGLESAHFVNSTGWPDPDHVISAYDLARLAANTIRKYPDFYKIYAERSFTWNGIKQDNRNPLFGSGIEGVDGLKTGHTTISKYGFVGSGVRKGKRRIFVINGLETSADRRSESRRIMRAAFERFKVYSLYKAGEKAGDAPVYMGKAARVDLVVKDDVNIGLFRPDRKNMKVQIRYNAPIPAPIAKGAHIADLVITAPGHPEKIVPLQAAQAVAQKSFLGRMGASLIGLIRGEKI